MGAFFLDLRNAARRSRSRPVFAAIVVATLAAGIGVTTALVGIGYAVLLRPLPYLEPEELVRLNPVRPGADRHRSTFSEGEFLELESRTTAFENLAAYYPDLSAALVDDDAPAQVSTTRVTATLFATMGVTPALGRFFDTGEDVPSGPPTAVLGYGLWLARYGGDPGIAGRSVLVDGQPTTIVGVAPEGFDLPGTKTALWMPLQLDRVDVRYHSGQYLWVLGRLATGISPRQATEQLETVSPQLTEEGLTRYAGTLFQCAELREDLVAGSRRPLAVLIAVALVVLTTMCFNLAGFFLTRVLARRRELAIRAALGAGARQLIRPVVLEILLLTAAGTMLGLGVARAAIQAVVLLQPAFLPRIDELGGDGSLWIFTAVTAALAAMLFGVSPALQAHRMAAPESLRERGPSTERAMGSRARATLVVLQVAGAVILLAGAGLFLRSLTALGRVDPGFRPQDVLSLRISAPQSSYPSRQDVAAFYSAVLEQVRALPGIDAAGASNHLPMNGQRSIGFAWREDQLSQPDALPQELEMRWVSPGFLDTLGIPLLQGRSFGDRDRPQTELASIVSKALAEALWPDENAIGKRFKLGRLVDSNTPWRTVVGIAGDVRHDGLHSPPSPTAYFVQGQSYASRNMSLVVKTELPAAAVSETIRRAVRSVDPTRPVYAIRPLADFLDESVSMWRVNSFLVTGFSLLTAFLASLGIYGLMAYSTRLRAHELTVRLVLGATPRKVLRLVLREAGVLAAVGIVLGLAGALTLSRFLESLLFGVTATDPVSLLAAVAFIAAAAFVASFLPGRRVTNLDTRLLRE